METDVTFVDARRRLAVQLVRRAQPRVEAELLAAGAAGVYLMPSFGRYENVLEVLSGAAPAAPAARSSASTLG